MGPALAIKAVSGRRFGLISFGVTQVLIDVETLIHLLRGDAVAHEFLHTFLGATLMAAPAAVFGLGLARLLVERRPLGGWVANAVGRLGETSWAAAAIGALSGAWSHVVLDGMMHPDARPFAPWSGANPFLNAMTLGTLHQLCVVTGVLGGVVLLARLLRRAR